MTRITIGMVSVLGFFFALPELAQAQSAFPAKAVRVVVPFPAGGGLDVGVRIVADKLRDAWQQPVIVDNRPGASGGIAAQVVSSAAADGHTLFIGTPGDALLPAIIDSGDGSQPVRDLSPVSLVGTSPVVLVAPVAFPANSLGELVALAKSKPDVIHYGTVGVGSAHHLAGELLKLQTGMKNLDAVNYQGLGQALNNLLGGQIQLVVAGIPPVVGHVKAGRIKVISVLASRRTPLAPEWPAMGEAGLPAHNIASGQDITVWFGFFGPPKLPPSITAAISSAVARAVGRPEVLERFAALGVEARGSTPEEFSAFLASEDRKYRALIKESGLKLK
ncbi:MAG: Bug family tripartite tricarboxylate transporter substrate binding protein [Betaproteobacteria bacterium]